MINFNSKQYLILGTSTDIGKTFFTCAICQKMIKSTKINAIKPLISGFNKNEVGNDTMKILNALNKEFSDKNIEETSPFRLKEPFSPLKAAKMENVNINFEEIVDFCKKNIKKSQEKQEALLIEGAGGVMTPINQQKTFLDLAQELNIEVILLGGVFLGAISQILCAVEALKSRKVIVNSVIINDFNSKDSGLKIQDISQEVENFSKIKCFSIADFC